MNHFLSLSLYFLLEYLPKVDALTKRECVLCEMIRYFNDRQQSIHGVGTTDTLGGAKPYNEKNRTSRGILSIVYGTSSSSIEIPVINPCQGRWWWRGCNRRAYIYTGTVTGTTSTIEGRKTKVRTIPTYFGTKITFYIRFLCMSYVTYIPYL